MFQSVKSFYEKSEQNLEKISEPLMPAVCGICPLAGVASGELYPVFMIPTIILFSWTLVWTQKNVTIWWLHKFISVSPTSTRHAYGGKW